MTARIEPDPTRRGRARRKTRRSAAAVLACGLCAAAALPPAASAAPPDAMPGIWQSHKFSFQYLGFTSTYSCDGLADKLRILLKATGARGDLKSQPGACAEPFGRPDKFARAELEFAALAPAADGAAADGAAADGKPVEGGWRSVSISDRSPLELRVGDCELVEQFRTQVLPMFATRNVTSHTTCLPYQESGSVIDLKFEVFQPIAQGKR